MFIMSLGERVMKSQCIKWFQKLSPKTKQWIWFVSLWLLGFLSLTCVSLIIKMIMRI